MVHFTKNKINIPGKNTMLQCYDLCIYVQIRIIRKKRVFYYEDFTVATELAL